MDIKLLLDLQKAKGLYRSNPSENIDLLLSTVEKVLLESWVEWDKPVRQGWPVKVNGIETKVTSQNGSELWNMYSFTVDKTFDEYDSNYVYGLDDFKYSQNVQVRFKNAVTYLAQQELRGLK